METRPITILGLLQFCAVLGGTLFVRSMMRLNGYNEDMAQMWSPIAIFVRDYGLVLLTIPTFWMLLALYLQRSTKPELLYWSVLIGGFLLLLCGLIFYFAVALLVPLQQLGP
jgi:hypothetical protein